MLECKDFVLNVENSNDSFTCYNATKEISIFNQKIEDTQDVEFWIAQGMDLLSIIDSINEYLDWLNNCEPVLKEFYESQLGEKVSVNWFSRLEIYSVNITFTVQYGHGATVFCGDDIILDHGLEINFDETSVESINLVG